MKKIFALLLILACLSALCATPVFASSAPNEVYVTISDANGKLALVQEPITLSDVDGDGVVTLNDVLYLAHEAKYPGGAAAGYASSTGEYGISLNKLWGTENGGGYGYCVNHISAMSLSDEIKSGDHINAYVYTDLETWSDTYCYFDRDAAHFSEAGSLTLTLSAIGYDENFNPVAEHVQGATILVNGKETEYKTDAQGCVSLNFSDDGTYIISAVSDTQTLVPPVCKVTVTIPQKPVPPMVYVLIALVVVIAVVAVVCLVTLRKKRSAR